MADNRIAYIWDELLMNECNRLPAVKNRAFIVHELIKSYKLLDNLKVVPSKPATYEDLKEFHSSMYLDHIKQMPQTLDEDYEISEADAELGLAYDCEPIPNLYRLIEVIAGGTLSAAEVLISGSADVAINWCGGWHHAQRFEAEGFCYVNDIVIAIERLRKTFRKVLYIDLDIHHGNGVENAYNIAKTVFTLSFHKHETGFYPGTGGVDYIGEYYGVGYACNFPFIDGVSDASLCYAFPRVFQQVMSLFEPDAIVIQCGADGITGDPIGQANITPKGLWSCVSEVLQCRKPTIILGGGGYNFANVARTWSFITGCILEKQLDDEIPDNEYFLEYSPGYNLTIDPAPKADKNVKYYLDKCLEIITGNLRKYLSKDLKYPDR